MSDCGRVHVIKGIHVSKFPKGPCHQPAQLLWKTVIDSSDNPSAAYVARTAEERSRNSDSYAKICPNNIKRKQRLPALRCKPK